MAGPTPHLLAPPPEALRLAEPAGEAWERFLAGRLTPEEERAALVGCWRRAVQLGAAPEGGAWPVGVSDAELHGRWAQALERLGEGAGLFAALEAQASQGGCRALLADPAGVILRSGRGGAFGDQADRARLVVGADWGEAARGTNAIGTAVAERRPVAVVGRAHYEARNHGLVCYATPVRDPFGDLVAVLDVTGARAYDHPLLGVAVSATAQAMEAGLRLRLYAEAVAGGWAGLLSGLGRRAAVVVEAPGRVSHVTEAAGRLLDGAPLGAAPEALCGLTWGELAERAAKGGAWEAGGRRWRVEPLADAQGRVLAAVLLLEPRPAPAATPRLPPAFDRILGSDPALRLALGQAARVARSTLPVLLLAETGTGKELLAKAIHQASDRAQGPFVALNCGALTAGLLDSELFGYAPGAFTGAAPGGSPGKLGMAHGGTLFLDEAAEMAEPLQAMLLRVLEDGTYYRLNDPQPRRTDFRLICATCRDLPERVREGRFRQDLYFRIRGATLSLPPLRARADLRELAQGLVQRLASELGRPAPALEPALLEVLAANPWLGNTRELKTALHHALVLAEEGEPLRVEHLPQEYQSPPAPLAPRAASRRDAEAQAVRAALLAANGNLSDAARRLGVARSTLYRLMERHGLSGRGD